MAKQRINRIWITGYKSLRSTTIELHRLNLLVGPNGAGKTNLLSLLRLLRSVAQRELQMFVGRAGGASFLLHYGAKTTGVIDVRSDLTTLKDGATYHLQLAYAAPDRLLISSEQLTDRSIDQSALFSGIREESRGAEAGREEGGLASEIVDFFQQLRVYHFHDTTERAPIRQNCDLELNRRLHEDGANLAAVLYKLQETVPLTFEHITRTVRQAAPFFHSFSLAPSALNKNVIGLRWRESGHDEDFNCHHLSDGTLRFIALAMLLLQPESDMPSVIILDEPELGLHPYAITLLASMIHHASNYRQVIVATQSPALLDHFDPEDVIVVERQDRATEFKRLDPAALAEWLEEYTLSELWDKNVFGGRPVPWRG